MRTKLCVLRADGNQHIGLGHIYRSIALANILKDKFDIKIVTKSNSLLQPINQAEKEVVLIPENTKLIDEPRWFSENFPENTIVVLDGYQFDENYQKKIKEFNFKLVYIDDLAQCVQHADIVINHSPGVKKSDYRVNCKTYFALGLDFAILRPSFLEFKAEKKVKKATEQSVFVSFGGADPCDFTFKSVKELVEISSITSINVLLGAGYCHDKIYDLKSKKIKIHKNLNESDVFYLMKNQDLAIVPASTTSMELATLNMPMFLGYFAENQESIYNGFIERNSAIPLGDFNEYDFSKLKIEIDNFNSDRIHSKPIIFNNSKESLLKIFEFNNVTIRTVESKDVEFLFRLSNEVIVRKNSFNSNSILYDEHKKWFADQLILNSNLFFIIQLNGKEIGDVRYEFKNNHYEIGISISEEYRGKGYAKEGLNLAIKRYFEENLLPIYAFIKKTNEPSINLFKKLGFQFLKVEKVKDEESLVFTLEK